MVTISVVEGTRPWRLLDAAAAQDQKASSLAAQIESQQRELQNLRAAWTGEAADAATARADTQLTRQQAMLTTLTTHAAALRFGGANLDPLRAQISAMKSQAVALGGMVGDDGTVTGHDTLGMMSPTLAAAYTTSLKNMLATFGRVDTATAEALRTGIVPATAPAPDFGWTDEDLYRGDPAGSDVNQDGIGDCYLVATMSAVANADPRWIRDRIAYDARTGMFDVTLWNGSEWQHIAVTQADIDANIAARGASGIDTATPGVTNPGAPLWPAVLESAYAKMKAPGKGIEGIESGFTPPALEALTGNNGDWIVPATEWMTPSQNIDSQIADALTGNQPVMLSTSVFGGPLQGMHVYSVEGIAGAGSDAVVTLRNPWGPDNGPPVIEARLGDLIGTDPLGGLGLGPTGMINIGRLGS